MRRLREVIDGAAAGALRIGVIDGEAGIGKSRLLEDLLDHAKQRGFAIYAGRADEVESGRPFAALFDALRVAEPPGDPVRAHIARLLVETEAGESGAVAVGIRDALIELVESAALRSPVLLAIEDLHWADVNDLHASSLIATRLSHLPIALVATLRRHPRRPELHGLLETLGRRGAHLVDLMPLEEGAVARLIQDLLGTAPGPGLIKAVTGAAGNPLFVREIVAALDQDGAIQRRDGSVDAVNAVVPRGLRLTILRRLAVLGNETLETLRVASVLGSTFSLDELSAVLDEPLPHLVATVRPALDAGFVGQHQERLSFRHDLIRTAVYEDLPLAIRRSLHLHVAKVLLQRGTPPDRVATHLLLAPDQLDDEAIDVALSLALPLRGVAPGLLVTLNDRVASSLPPGDARGLRLQAETISALVAVGHPVRAEEFGRILLKMTDDPDVRLVAARHLRFALLRQNRIAEMIDHIGGVLAQEDLPAEVRRELGGFLASAYLFMGDVESAERQADLVIEDCRRARDYVALLAGLCAAGWVAAARGSVSEAKALTGEALEISPPPVGGEHAHLYHGVVLIETDEITEAISTLDDGELLWSSRDPNSIPVYLYAKGGARFLAGDWDDALAELQAGLQMKEEGVGFATGSLFAYAFAGHIAFRRNDINAAERFIFDGERDVGMGGASLGIDFLWWTRALLLEAAGDVHRAYETLAFAWDATATFRYLLSWRSTAPDLVRLALAVGELSRARAVTLEAEEGARRARGLASADGAALLCRGLRDADPSTLTKAVESYRRSPRRFDHARAAEHAALSAVREGDRSAARALLDEALDLYGALGATRETSRVAAAMRQLGLRRGARTQRDRPSYGWAALTPTERQVVALAVEGLTNPQIAERLFISKRTVQTHLSHVFAKLGLSSRVELVSLAAKMA